MDTARLFAPGDRLRALQHEGHPNVVVKTVGRNKKKIGHIDNGNIAPFVRYEGDQTNVVIEYAGGLGTVKTANVYKAPPPPPSSSSASAPVLKVGDFKREGVWRVPSDSEEGEDGSAPVPKANAPSTLECAIWMPPNDDDVRRAREDGLVCVGELVGFHSTVPASSASGPAPIFDFRRDSSSSASAPVPKVGDFMNEGIWRVPSDSEPDEDALAPVHIARPPDCDPPDSTCPPSAHVPLQVLHQLRAMVATASQDPRGLFALNQQEISHLGGLLGVPTPAETDQEEVVFPDMDEDEAEFQMVQQLEPL